MCLVRAHSLNYRRGFRFLFLLRLQGLFVLLCLEFRYCVEKLNDYKGKLGIKDNCTSFSGYNLKFSLMILIFNSGNVTTHEPKTFFFGTFLAELRFTLLLLTDFLGWAFILCQYWLLDLIFIYLLIENARECMCERVLKDSTTLIHWSPIIELWLSGHPFIV